MTDADQFEAFVRRHQDMVFATAIRLVGNPADAEDLAQTVFLRAFQHFDTIGSSPLAVGWLKTVTRNACVNHLKRYRWRWRLFSELEGTEPDGHTDFDAADSRVSPATMLEQSDRQERLDQAIQALPHHQRIPLVLFHFEDLTYQEIAVALCVSLGKVKTDIHRGREALKKEMMRAFENDHAPNRP